MGVRIWKVWSGFGGFAVRPWNKQRDGLLNGGVQQRRYDDVGGLRVSQVHGVTSSRPLGLLPISA